jgi:hypothetical protein
MKTIEIKKGLMEGKERYKLHFSSSRIFEEI